VSARLCFDIFYLDLGFSAPLANGHSIFAIPGKALWEQCAMPPAVLGATHFVSSDIAKSSISPHLDRDRMFNELWWLNNCFCEVTGICVGNPFGGEAANLCCHSKCEMTDVGDPLYGMCGRLCIDKLLKELWWLNSCNYCFCESIGNGAVGNLFFGGEAVYDMIAEDDSFYSSTSICLCDTDQCSLPPARDFPSAFASTQSLQVMMDKPHEPMCN